MSFWNRKKPPSKPTNDLTPMDLHVHPMPNGNGAVFQLLIDDKREMVFVLSKSGVVQLVDTLADIALCTPDDDEAA